MVNHSLLVSIIAKNKILLIIYKAVFSKQSNLIINLQPKQLSELKYLNLW